MVRGSLQYFSEKWYKTPLAKCYCRGQDENSAIVFILYLPSAIRESLFLAYGLIVCQNTRL